MITNHGERLLSEMIRIRRVEETLADLYPSQEMRTPTHFSIGQEAVAVGVCAALRRDDVVYSGHRCHSHYLAKGGDLHAMVAELYGRETGCARGRGGSVHLNDPEAGLIASSAILGQTMAVAVGTALAFTMDGRDDVAVS
ncbi:MAG: thiamine pyrophosphate-dependent enzyme, partial [Candidatus Rokuibacteriota bacterium]